MTYIYPVAIYSNIFFKIILSIIMVYIAYQPKKLKQLIRQVIIFYLTSFLFGGVAFALIYVIKPQEILMKNGLFLGTYPLKTIFIGAIIATIILITGFKIVKNKISKKDMYCNIKIIIEKKQVETTAIVDTGNMLKDPITGQNTEQIIGGDFKNVPEIIRNKYIAKLKLIPYSSLGRQNGMLIGIKSDEIIIETEENAIRKDNIIIGIYNKSLTKKGEYRALIGIDIL